MLRTYIVETSKPRSKLRTIPDQPYCKSSKIRSAFEVGC